MNVGPFPVDVLELTPQERAALQAGGMVRELLERRLSYCGEGLRLLPRESLGRLVRGHLRDILDNPVVAPGAAMSLPPVAIVTDDEVDRRFREVLQNVPPGQRPVVREWLRRGLARDL